MKWIRLFHLTVLLVGLLWLGCDIPVSPLPNVGDEIRLTNDPGPNRDPFWYTNGDPDSLEGSQICFHDGQTIFLYDWDSGDISELYTAPEVYEITTLDGIRSWWYGVGYAFALYGGGHAVVIAIIDGDEVELLRVEGPPIESMSVNYNSEDDPPWGKHFAIILSRNQSMYIVYTNGSDDDSSFSMYLGEGYDIHWESDTFFVRGNDSTSIYRLELGYDGSIFMYESFSDGNLNRYPSGTLCVTNKESTRDIWNYFLDYRVTDNEGEEKELDRNERYYVLFNRVTDGQSDLYVARWIEQ
ncbi:hypothetical protein KAU45_03180 [bacterium]|nr:hypothetical protein [bacterium]